MGAALPFSTRRQIISDYQAGDAYTDLAARYGVAYHTVRTLCRRFDEEGEPGLRPRYARCGPKTVRSDALIYRAACTLKRRHPKWGAAFIRLQLEQRYPGKPLPAVRTMQTWFKNKGLQPARSKLPKAEKRWAKAVHDIWQVDAKEQQHLTDHSQVCWLTITDEHSSAILAAPVFSPWTHLPGALEAVASSPD